MRFVVLLIVVALVGLPSPARAQSGAATADLAGVVRDESMGVLAGAIVTAINVETRLTRTTVSLADGRFLIATLPPGRYAVRVELTGFKPAALPDVDLTLGATVAVEAILQLGARTEELTVTGTPPPVDVERTSLSAVIGRSQIDQLPTNGRNFIAFSLITPAVTVDRTPQQGSSASSGLSFAGQRARSNNISVDGLDNNDPQVGSVRATFSQEAVREFQILSHWYSAEFGRASGGVVNIVTRSGTNTASARGFLFFRDDALNAREYFERVDPAGTAVDVLKAPYRQNQFGATVGGPFLRDRTFYFASFERQAITANNFVTIDDRTPVTTFGQVRGTPAEIIRAAGFELETGHVPYRVESNQFLAKLDQNLSHGQTLSLRYNYAGNLNENIEPFGGIIARSRGGALDSTDHAAGGTYVAVRGRLVNELRAQWAYRDQIVYALDPLCGGLCDREDQGGPTVEITGVASLGRQRFTPQLRNAYRLQVLDTVSVMAGPHVLKAGIDFNTVDQTKGTLPSHFGGRYIFAPLPAISGLLTEPVTAIQAFALGVPAAYVQGYGNSSAVYRTGDLSLFVQDDWRMRHNLTIKLGLRYQTQFWPDWEFNDPGLGVYRFPSDRNDLAPRLAIAWDPAADRKTSIHGSYGIFYDNQLTSVVGIANIIDGTQDGVRTLVVRLPGSIAAWQSPGRRLPEPTSAPPSLMLALDPRAETPYAHHASAGIDRELPGELSVSVVGLYSRGFRLIGTLDMNPIVASLGSGRRPLDVDGVAGTSASILQYTSYGRTWYRALVLTAQKRFGSDARVLASYTLSKAEDNSTDFQSAFIPEVLGQGRNPSDPEGLPIGFDPLSERGPTVGDQRHRFVASGMFFAPARTQVAAIVTAASGAPFNILAGADLNGNGDGGAFPSDRARRDPADPASSVSRNAGRLPAEATVDLRVSRRFDLGNGRRSVELIVDLFNLFNRTNIVDVNGVFGVGAFPAAPLASYGQPLRTGPPRIVQVGARATF